jgi:hypothetical protein
VFDTVTTTDPFGNENNLDGPLPFEPKELTELKKLELRGNKIVGSIPLDETS